MKKFVSLFLALTLLLSGCAALGDEAAFSENADRALEALCQMLAEQTSTLWVYKDFSDTQNHFTQKSMMWGLDQSLMHDMDENWQEAPHSGTSCIRCSQDTTEDDWGGWMFLNGTYANGQATVNDGTAPGQGVDLTGATELHFWARGEKGDEAVQFFCFGFGYEGNSSLALVDYPDSACKVSSCFYYLTDEWQEYTFALQDEDLSSIACGFGFVLSGAQSGTGETVFYLDDIYYTGDFSQNEAIHPMLRSYQTENQYIKNAAFTYDNALAAMAFISADRRQEAGAILDSFVYAVNHDRYRSGRIRNAYAAGDIAAFPGWGDTARLPGWYDLETKTWYEDQYQTGCNVGNTSYAALALLQYDACYGSELYRQTAMTLMDWVIENCASTTPGFTGGYDGWPESGVETVYTYKSIEHNIDAYAAFLRLYNLTGESRYKDAADSALTFIASMYNGRYFYTGTGNDGITPNTDGIMLDAQVWACLSLGEAFTPYANSLQVVSQMATDEGAYPFCAENKNGGWWAEGTAYTALMHSLLGNGAQADAAMSALASIQLESGLFPAATVENLSTGLDLFTGDPWEYGTDAHVAPTAWFVMAYYGFNPYAFGK